MIANKSPSVVRLSLYTKRTKSIVQWLDKYTILFVKAFFDYFLLLSNWIFLYIAK